MNHIRKMAPKRTAATPTPTPTPIATAFEECTPGVELDEGVEGAEVADESIVRSDVTVTVAGETSFEVIEAEEVCCAALFPGVAVAVIVGTPSSSIFAPLLLQQSSPLQQLYFPLPQYWTNSSP